MKFSVSSTVTLGSRGVPEAVNDLAHQLAALHGNVLVSREKHGIHLNFACPMCLHEDGDKELESRHFALNAEKYFNLGAYAMTTQASMASGAGLIQSVGLDRREWSGICMKNRAHRMSVADLLSYTPLSKRSVKASRAGRVTIADGTEWLVPWQHNPSILIPGGPGDGGPGDLIPLNTPQGSATPAGQYLLRRGYDLGELWEMFNASFCVREWPESEKRQYRKMPGGFRDSPQGRACFFGHVFGVPRIWQARILDYDQVMPDGSTQHWVYNGQTHQWALVAVSPPGGRPVYQHGFNSPDWPWKPSKYRTSNGGRKSEVVLGFDAAVKWNQEFRPGKPPVVIVFEGPLDAARFGRPAVSVLGKYINEVQAELMAKVFAYAVLVPDNDRAGAETLKVNQDTLTCHMKTMVRQLAPSRANGTAVKDAGDLNHAEAMHYKQTWLNEL